MTKPNPPGTPHASTTGGAGPRVVDQTNWRRKLAEHRLKFDDVAKQAFLEVFAKTSRVMEACKVANISWATLKHHRENDPEFAEAYEEARLSYRDRVHEHADNLMFNGMQRPVLGGKFKDEVITTYTEYPISLIQMELRRVDPEYKDRQEVDVKGGGGVVVVPADMSADDWVKEQQEKNKLRTRPDENDPLK